MQEDIYIMIYLTAVLQADIKRHVYNSFWFFELLNHMIPGKETSYNIACMLYNITVNTFKTSFELLLDNSAEVVLLKCVQKTQH